MKSIKYLILSLIMLLPVSLLAQKVDQVTLNNGTTIRGNITAMVPGGNVTIDDLAGNTWVFAMEEVEKVDEVDSFKSNKTATFDPGLVNITSIGFLAGAQSSQQIAPFSLQSSFGFKMKSGVYAGALTGMEFLNINHLPLMLDLQYFLRISDVSPVIILRGGYVLPTKFEDEVYDTDYSYSGGIAGSLGVGIKIRTRANFAWDMSLLYRYMETSYTETYGWNDYTNTYRDVYNRLELRVGFYLDRP